MREIDFERAMTLMSVMEKVANVAPQATSLLGEAQLELNEIVDDAKANAAERADARREEEAKAEADRQAKLRAANPVPELPNELGQDLDTDNDGVTDSEDPDDDNDGVEDEVEEIDPTAAEPRRA